MTLLKYKTIARVLFLVFEHWNICNSYLFRVSSFVLRISDLRSIFIPPEKQGLFNSHPDKSGSINDDLRSQIEFKDAVEKRFVTHPE